MSNVSTKVTMKLGIASHSLEEKTIRNSLAMIAETLVCIAYIAKERENIGFIVIFSINKSKAFHNANAQMGNMTTSIGFSIYIPSQKIFFRVTYKTRKAIDEY